MKPDLCALSATELLAAYRAKTLSPVEATRAALARIEKLNPALNCFNLVDEKGALESARASEARWKKGTPIGLLDGVPTSANSTRFWPPPPPHDLRKTTTEDKRRTEPWPMKPPPPRATAPTPSRRTSHCRACT
jgi:hypothetical protein